MSHVSYTLTNHPQMLITHFGLKLVFTYASAGLTVQVDSAYYEHLCGLCGTCNQDRTDEFVLPSGELVNNILLLW